MENHRSLVTGWLGRRTMTLYFKKCTKILAHYILPYLILRFVLFPFSTAYGATVLPSWDANTESDVEGYRIYYGTSSRNYDYVVDVGNVTSYQLDLPSEDTYYIALTAYDSKDNESNSSEELIVYGTDWQDTDTDDDGISDGSDNCPMTYNPDQADSDGDWIGDVCETYHPGEPMPTPMIECNIPPTITPRDMPISFTATATDNCDGNPYVEITGFDCSKSTKKKSKQINKKLPCMVDVVGDTITILDAGGVGGHITWTVYATDNCGNVTETQCEVEVAIPGR